MADSIPPAGEATPAPGPSDRNTARWPRRLLALHAVLRRNGPGAAGVTAAEVATGEAPAATTAGAAAGAADHARQKALEETWLLLRAALTRFLHHHAARFGTVDPEEIRDLCSEKSLELVRRIESGSWDLTGREPDEVAGFVSTAARNGLIDLFRSRGRLVREEDTVDEPGALLDRIDAAGDDHPEARAQRSAFATSLRDCARMLADRDRVAWFLRVFYEMPSRDIARHPEVNVKSSHVDVILQRCRQAVRDCMTRKGHDATELPAGTFAELWFAFRAERAAALGGSDE